MRQIQEMAQEIVRRVSEIERELALISAIRALENLRNLVREAREWYDIIDWKNATWLECPHTTADRYPLVHHLKRLLLLQDPSLFLNIYISKYECEFFHSQKS